MKNQSLVQFEKLEAQNKKVEKKVSNIGLLAMALIFGFMLIMILETNHMRDNINLYTGILLIIVFLFCYANFLLIRMKRKFKRFYNGKIKIKY